MQKLFLAVLINFSFVILHGASFQDTTFIGYNAFSKLRKKEIKQQFAIDKQSEKIISNYYKHNRNALKSLLAIIPLTTIGTYFAIWAAKATNGMASTVSLVLAILFLLPASILLLYLFVSLASRKRRLSKKLLYEELKQYFQTR